VALFGQMAELLRLILSAGGKQGRRQCKLVIEPIAAGAGILAGNIAHSSTTL